MDRTCGEAELMELLSILNGITDTYYDFVVTVMHYAKKKPERLEAVLSYVKEHKDATTSDVLTFMADQPDFYEDMA